MQNMSNLPTQYSSSRFGQMNSRGQPMVGSGLVGATKSQNGGPVNFGAMSNSSHYNNRNMSPQPGGLQAGAEHGAEPEALEENGNQEFNEFSQTVQLSSTKVPLTLP